MSSGKKPDDVRPEYDLATLKNGERGKYLKRYERGSNVVAIDLGFGRSLSKRQSRDDDALREVLSRRQREDASAE